MFKTERKRFFGELSKISALRLIPSQANYCMVELSGKYTAKDLTKALRLEYNLFVKDLSKKAGGEYLRFAVRSQQDNDKLIAALKAVLK